MSKMVEKIGKVASVFDNEFGKLGVPVDEATFNGCVFVHVLAHCVRTLLSMICHTRAHTQDSSRLLTCQAMDTTDFTDLVGKDMVDWSSPWKAQFSSGSLGFEKICANEQRRRLSTVTTLGFQVLLLPPGKNKRVPAATSSTPWACAASSWPYVACRKSRSQTRRSAG